MRGTSTNIIVASVYERLHMHVFWWVRTTVSPEYYLRSLTWPPKHSSLNLTLSADPTCAQLCQNEGRDPTKSSRLLPPKYLKICSYSEFISAGSSTWSNNKLVGHPAKSSRKA